MKSIIKISPFLSPRKPCQRGLWRGVILLRCLRQVHRGPCYTHQQEPCSHSGLAPEEISFHYHLNTVTLMHTARKTLVGKTMVR